MEKRMPPITVGVQLFGFAKLLKKDPEKTLRQIRQIGYEAIEPVISLPDVEQLWNYAPWTLQTLKQDFALAKELGFQVPSAHINTGLFGKTPHKIIEGIRQIHQETGIGVFVFSGMFSTPAGAKRWGPLLGAVAAGVQALGCRVLYHNHDCEFSSPSGKRVLDIFLEHAGQLVGLQLDIGWAGIGWEELAAVAHYKDRIVEIHCKDFVSGARGRSLMTMPTHFFTAIGDGCIRTRQALSMIPELTQFNGVIIIDQDHSANGILADAQKGLQNVKEMIL